jgi:outer membrane protein TolC
MSRALIALAVFGCVPSTSELRAPVDRDLARRLGTSIELAPTDPHAVDQLLAKPVDVAAAVRIALIANPRMRAALDELGIAGGNLAAVAAPGPAQVDVQFRRGGGATELEIDAIQPILQAITGGRARAATRAELAAVRATSTATALRLAARVEIAFHGLLAAQQEVELRRTAFEAADAAATLREHMHAAGNTTELAVARERDAREQARVDLVRAQAEVEVRREAVNALLGVSGAQTKWTASGTLPALPSTPPALDDLETAAVAASLDLTARRERETAASDHLDEERLRGWLPEVGVGVSAIDVDHTWEIGPAVRVGVPLLDQRQGPRARARAELARADHELAATTIELLARVRAARSAALAAYDAARRLRDDVLPLRQQIVEQTLLHYNAMDADPFQLIVSRRELADAGHQYLEALRGFANAMSEISALRRGVQLEP